MSGTLPTWAERWLGVEAAGPGEGTVWRIDGTWGWPAWVTLLFVIFAVAWVVYFYLREGTAAGRAMRTGLVLLRLGVIAVVVFMIAEVVLSLRRTGLPSIVVMVDDSGSMGIADRYEDSKLRALIDSRIKQAGLEQATRLNLAKSVLLENDADLLARIEKNYKLKVYFVSAAARAQPGSLENLREAIRQVGPTGESSRLGAGVRSILGDLRGSPPAAIVVLTDGITTQGETLSEVAHYARRKGVPLFTIGLGSEEPVRDLELSDLLVDEVVFIDDVVNFQFKLTGTGFAGRTVEVVLREKDDPAVLARIKAVVGADGQPLKLQIPFRPTKVGESEYVVEVEHLKEESNADNNRQQRLVSVRKEQIQILLAQAYPSFEFRYLKNLLDRDNTIKLKTVLQDSDVEYADQDTTALRVFPVRREELFEYDVIIFGDVNPSFLSPTVMTNLHDFVEQKGGGVAFIAGPQFMPQEYRNTRLAPLIPVEIGTIIAPEAGSPEAARSMAEGFKVMPTDLGLANSTMQLGDSLAETERIWRNLPDLYWLLECPNLKPGARVLAEHPTRLTNDGRKLPVFIMQYVGAGKVLFHATDETWRWRFRVGDVFFARYWIQTVRYLSRSKLLGKDRSAEILADRRQYQRGDTVRLRVRFMDERVAPAEDDGVTVVLEREGDKNQRMKLERNANARGVFEAVVNNAIDGRYHAWIASPSLEGKAPATDFLVVAPPGEFERVRMDAAELQASAEETHGHFYRIADVSKLFDDLPPGRQVPIESLPPEVLWNKWWVLSLFMALLIGEWILRKRKGML